MSDARARPFTRGVAHLGVRFSSDVLASAFAAALQDKKDSDAIANDLADKVAKGDLEIKTETRHYELRLDGGKWRVFRNYEAQLKKENDQRMAADLLRESEELRRAKKPEDALAKVEAALKLHPELERAKKRKQQLQAAVELQKQEQAYIANVKLFDLKAKYYRTYLDARIPGVDFKLKNEGDRTLDLVEVTVYVRTRPTTVDDETKPASARESRATYAISCGSGTSRPARNSSIPRRKYAFGSIFESKQLPISE